MTMKQNIPITAHEATFTCLTCLRVYNHKILILCKVFNFIKKDFGCNFEDDQWDIV